MSEFGLVSKKDKPPKKRVRTTPVEEIREALPDSVFELPVELDPYKEIVGQTKAKKAMAIAIIGNFPICFYGPHGQGKSTLIRLFSETYKAIHSKKMPPELVEECVSPDDITPTAQIFAEIKKIKYSRLFEGIKEDGETRKEFEKKIRKVLNTEYPKSYLVFDTFWDMVGQSYNSLHLTPKSLSTAIKTAWIISTLDKSSYITKESLKEAFTFVTFTSKKVVEIAPPKKSRIKTTEVDADYATLLD
jgi:energy-coupling factor transporter ATP-binding protein EcfA2